MDAQVITCYGLYLIPASLLVRRYSFFQQYLYGLLTLAPLELLGYALGTSRAYPGNLLDQVLGERNFTLAMVVFFGWILPLGNGAVAGLERRGFGKTPRVKKTQESPLIEEEGAEEVGTRSTTAPA